MLSSAASCQHPLRDLILPPPLSPLPPPGPAPIVSNPRAVSGALDLSRSRISPCVRASGKKLLAISHEAAPIQRATAPGCGNCHVLVARRLSPPEAATNGPPVRAEA